MRYRTLVLFAACSLLAMPQAAPAQSLMGSLPIDGIPCQTTEGVVLHVHANLQIYDRGRTVAVPASIGIPLTGNCLYWLHTHADNGIIHIESPVVRTFTLGQFFDIWGMDLSQTKAAGLQASHGHALSVTVNGAPWKGDPRAIPLRDHEQIVIQLGPPFAKPASVDWSKM